jgi:hypothetical protein
MFESYEDKDEITLDLSLKTGETVKFEGKRYPLFRIQTAGPIKPHIALERKRRLAHELNGYFSTKKERLIFEAPLILEAP